MAPAAAPPPHPPGWSPLLELPPLADPVWTSTTNNLFGSMSPSGLGSLLWTQRDKVVYRHPGVLWRLVTAACVSLVNAVFGLLDAALHGRAVAREPLPNDPVFVLGLPRSGTTLLHQLLAADPQFLAPDTFQVAHPTSFLTERAARQRLLGRVLEERRPMDGVAQTWTGTFGREGMASGGVGSASRDG